MAELVPVPSATVILMRDGAIGPEVLMMQRNLSSGFVPGMHLFPGGAIDAEDSAQELYALCSGIDDAQASAALGIKSGGLAYRIAAIREAFEEAGLLIAYDKAGRLLDLDDPLVIERFKNHRRALNDGERDLLDIVRHEKLTLATDQLIYFSHWITPPGAPRRYNTRFFIAAAPPAQASLHDNQETIADLWIRPAEALERLQRGDFKMRFPTARSLEVFVGYATTDAILRAMRERRDIPTYAPRISKEGLRVMPGEPGYDDLAKSKS